MSQGRAVDIAVESGELAVRRAADQRVSDGPNRFWAAFTPAFPIDYLRLPNNGLTDLGGHRQDHVGGRIGRCEVQPMRSARETMIPSGPRT